MPAKGRPRYRYVAFRVSPAKALSRGELTARLKKDAALRGLSAADPWLTRYDGEYGILRVRHDAKEGAIALLTSLRGGVTVATLGTSGTIRALVARDLPHEVEPGGNKWRAEENRKARRAKPASPERGPAVRPRARPVLAERAG